MGLGTWIDNNDVLISFGNDELWYEDAMATGTMLQLAASVGDVDTSDNLTCTNAFGRAVILNGSNLKVFDPSSTKITTANVGSHPPDPFTKLTGETSEAVMYVVYITSLSGACTIYGIKETSNENTFESGETVTGLDDDGNAISFVLNANEVTPKIDIDGGHWYDFGVFGNDSSYGELPAAAYLGAMYLGRLYIAGDPDSPYGWYASAQRNIHNWLYDQEDVASAVRGGDTDVGDLQDIPRALVPYGNSYLLFGCASSMYVMINDPHQGGTLVKVSRDIGMFGARSWCHDENGNLYFLGTGGIYRLSPDLQQLDHLTELVLPRFIKTEGIDPSTHRVCMEWDKMRHGFEMSIVDLSDGTNSCYWYDSITQGLFPESYQPTTSTYSMLYYDASTAAHKGMLMGGGDGYIRVHDDSETDDDLGPTTIAVDSYVTLGPFKMGKNMGDEGIFQYIHGILAGGETNGSQSDSNNVTWYVYVGKSPEEVMENVAVDNYVTSGILKGPGYVKGNKSLRRVRGRFCAIRLRNNSASQTWGFEELEVSIEPVGRL